MARHDIKVAYKQRREADVGKPLQLRLPGKEEVLLSPEKQILPALPVHEFDIEGHMGHIRLKPPHDLGQEVETGAEREAHVQRLGVLGGHILSLFHGGFQFCPDAAQFGAEPGPRRGQAGPLYNIFRLDKQVPPPL